MFRLLVTNSFWSLLSHLLSRGSLVIASMVLARSLNATQFATYSYFQLTVSMIGAYAAMGMGMTASRFFAEIGSDQQDRDQVPIGTLWILSLMFAILAFLMMFVLPRSLFDAGLGVPRWLMAVGVLALVLNVVPGGAILGLEQYRKATVISALSGIVLLAGAYWAISKGSTTLAMLALIGSFFVQCIGQTVIVVRHVGLDRLIGTVHLNISEINKVFHVALPMLIVTLMSASGTWILGRIILASTGGAQAFVYYTIGLQWFALALLVPGMLSRVALPMMVRVRGATALDRSQMQRVTRITALLAVVSGAVMAVSAAALGPWIMSLYGGNYPASRWFIAAFMLAGVVLAPVNTIGNAIIAHNWQWQWLYITVLWFVALWTFGLIFQGYGQWVGPITLTGAALVMAFASTCVAKSRSLI